MKGMKAESKWERRKKPAKNMAEVKPSDLPLDYLKLVESTISDSLEAGLNAVKKLHPEAHFYARGAVFSDEVMLTITLALGTKAIAATTAYASADFNPLVEKPTIEMALAACLDALGGIFALYLDETSPQKIEQITHHALGALEDAPFEWSPVEMTADGSQIPVFVKIDKSNPRLDEIAEQWLEQNDPDYLAHKAAEDDGIEGESAEFLEERLEAIKAAKSGGSGATGGSGPITH